ncbi:MAG: hypothetical protein AB1704_20425 [Pseudomonadota bacterium]
MTGTFAATGGTGKQESRVKAKDFDLKAALDGAVLRCREQYFTPQIERPASANSPYALVGSVSCDAGSMAMCWQADGRAVRQSMLLFKDHPNSDFDLLLVK